MHDFQREPNTPGTRPIIIRGDLLAAAFAIAIVASAIAVWTQYYAVYFSDPFLAQAFGLPYTPPNFYTYFLPIILAFLLLSAIPLVAYYIKGTERLRAMTALGLIMCVGAFALPMYFHIAMGILVLFYVVSGCLIIETVDKAKKELKALKSMEENGENPESWTFSFQK